MLYGKLLEVLSDIQQIGEGEIFESASASFSANLNPIRSLSLSINYNLGQINLNSNNLTKEEFDEIIKLTEEVFPVSESIKLQTNVIQNTTNELETDVKINRQKQQANSKSVFVIMSFNDDHRDSYFVAIQPTLKKMGFDPIRVDEIQHNNMVTKEIIEAIENFCSSGVSLQT